MNVTMMRVCLTAAMCSGLLVSAACSTAPRSESERRDIESDAKRTLETAERSDPSMGAVLRQAEGYAVFPTIAKGAVGVGGAYGNGVLFEKGVAVGFCDVSQATIGFQLGGQAYSEIIAFQTREALNNFKSGNFAFDAQATAVALRSGVGTNAKYDHGVAVFTMNESGLMYEASIGGQKFSYQPK